jgi:hypothetical protein
VFNLGCLRVGNFLDHATYAELGGGSVRVNAAVEHPNDIFGCGENELDMMGDKNDGAIAEERPANEMVEEEARGV